MALICGACIAMLTLFAGIFETWTHHYQNASPSMPLGGYWLPLRAEQEPHIGQIAMACLSGEQLTYARRHSRDLGPSNVCDGAPSIIKVIAAISGARVRVDDRGVWINGALLANSAPLRGLPVAPSQTIPPGKVWLWSPVRIALDSRYLGPMAIASIVYPDRGLSPIEERRLTPSFLSPARGALHIADDPATRLATYRRPHAPCLTIGCRPPGLRPISQVSPEPSTPYLFARRIEF